LFDSMELIVHTAHGTADVSVDVRDQGVSLRDVIAAVTGQAGPDTARVDGRLVNATDTLDTCGAVSGAVIDTLLDDRSGSDAPTIAVLRQLTGPGAGRHVPLSAGHYRIGPGRRQQTDELSADAADLVAFELEIDSSGVTVSPPRQPSPTVSPLLLGGADIDSPMLWQGGHLVAAGRVFRLDDPVPDERPAPNSSVDGRITHNRPPGVVETDRTIAEAIDEAQTRAPRLWHRRRNGAPLSVGIGLGVQRSSNPLALDLGANRVTAVAGTGPHRDALARSILVDSCTTYGPADLDVVIASPPGELAGWDWAKWLPHLRWGASVDLLTNDLEMASFTARSLARPTIIIVTADELWNDAASPLRSVVMDGMKNASIIALTNDRSTAPSSATSLITLDSERPGAATLTRLGSDEATLDMLVPLIDAAVAADVARHLAPLVDPDLGGAATHATHHVPLGDIVQIDTAADRWNAALGAPGNPIEMVVGSVAGVTVGVDFELNASVAISGSSIDEAVDLATVLTLSIASTWSPTEATVLIIDHRAGRNTNPLQQLPHHAGTFSKRDAVSIDRLLSRLRDDFGREHPSSTRLVVVINGLAETELAAPGLVAELSTLAADALGVHLVIATARPLAALPTGLRSVCAVEIAIDGHGGARRGTLHDRRRKLQTPFSPYDETTLAADALTVRPFVFGRGPSALERRLERGSDNDLDNRDSVVARLVQHLDDLAELHDSPRPRPLLPVPLPARVVASELWSAHTGDGVPLGVLDVADSGARTGSASGGIDWWLPGVDGSRLLVGSARSGVRLSLDVLLVGVADRFATDDITVIAIEQNDRRRAAMAALRHVSQVVSPDHEGAVEAVLADVAQVMYERSTQADFRLHDHPTILVLARDIERLSEPALAALTHLLADGAEVGVNVVASGARPDGIETTIAVARRVVVGALSDSDDYARLHVEQSASVEHNVGRAQMVESSGPVGGGMSRTVELVQLAELDAPLDSVLNALAAIMEADG
jgi:hypothetical protein